jgi:hypothetical protein
LEKEKGTVQQIVNGKMLEKLLLDVGVTAKPEREMLYMTVAKNQTITCIMMLY